MKKKSSNPRVSIIIPLPKFNAYIREAVPYYEKLGFQDFEVIVLPDGEEAEKLSETLDLRVIPSGKVGPAEKRDMGAKVARGEILAFTDDDAFPDPGWLTDAMGHFEAENVAAVGGPAVTPGSDGFWQRVSGGVYESFMTSGGYRKRYVAVGKVHEDYDLPSVNLIVRRDVFEKVGGFDSTFYPGEDTKLCLEIKKLGLKILYDPKVLVYHHRRALFPNHFRQIANYALHRGYFAKKYPETSRKLTYFLPSLLLAGIVIGGILSFFIRPVAVLYGITLALYFILDLALNFRLNPLEYLMTILGVFFSHLTYGFFFIKGLFFTKDLKR